MDIRALIAAGAAMLATATHTAAIGQERYDLIIRNGLVLDGSGAPGRRVDVAIRDDRIIRMGDLGDVESEEQLDAQGMVVTPGFISLHDHSSPQTYGAAHNLLTQGVTTVISNADGRGQPDLGSQFDESDAFAVNIGAYIGFNAVWSSVMGPDNRRPSPAELARMRELIARGFEFGAWGLSAGLDYKPAYWATTAEVIGAARAAAASRSNFPNHERLSEANGQSSLAGVAETIAIAEQAQLMPVITHMKLQGGDRGKVEELFGLFEAAGRRGVYVGADAYPYTYGYTSSVAQLLFPAWAQEGGREAALQRLAQPELRRQIARQIEQQIDTRWMGVDGIYFPKARRGLKEVMRALGVESPGEAVMRLYEQGDQPIILHFGLEQDLRAILADPRVAISCDCGATRADYGHPRYWGAYPRFLGRYVRERRIATWEEAVRRMTALPAAMVGMTERGLLRPGMIADITVFDPRSIIDRATLDNPTRQSVGIRAVVINGRYALRDGKALDSGAGRLLRRSKHMPSRPMNQHDARRVRAHGDAANELHAAERITVDIEMSLTGELPRPHGRLKLLDPEGRILVDMTVPGVLQTTQGWASITGVGRWADRPSQPINVIVEETDPSMQGASTITVSTAGRAHYVAVLGSGAVEIVQERRPARLQ